MVHPVLPAGLELLIEGLHLQPLEHLGVGALGLAVAPGVSDGGVANLGADASTIGLEGAAGKLASVVGNDSIRHAETAGDPLDEFDCKPN